jgi:ligand-binding sensor domain-containing protein
MKIIRKKGLNNMVIGYFVVLLILAACTNENNPVPGKETVEITKAETAALPGVNTMGTGKDINNVLQDRKGAYWFTSNGSGVYCYIGNKLTQYTEKEGLLSNTVWTIQEDNAGNLWFTTSKGLCRFDGKVFTSFKDVLDQVLAVSLHYTTSDLFFSHKGNVYRYDGKGFSLFPIHPAGYKPDPSDLNRPYGIYCAFQDRSGNLWFGTDQKGVCRYDGKSFTYFTEKGLDGGAVRSIYQDKKGHLWFGNNGYGLFCYDGKTLKNITQEKGLDNPAFLQKAGTPDKPGTLARVWAINEDDNGNLWIGTVDAGVWKYDGKQLTNFTTKDGLNSNIINTIYKDKAGDLWFITDAGINRFDGQRFIKFDGFGTSTTLL